MSSDLERIEHIHRRFLTQIKNPSTLLLRHIDLQSYEIVDKDAKLVIPTDDDIVTACLMCRDGQAIRKN